MNQEEAKRLMLSILGEVAVGQNTEHLNSKLPLAEQLNLDSMDFLDIGMVIRQRTGLKIKEEDFASLTTLDKAADFLAEKIPQK